MKESSLYQIRFARRRTLLGGSSLWQGPDHLLVVRSLRFREEYRRFYYREIQAFTVQDLSGASILKWWDLLAATVVLLLFMFFVKGTPSFVFTLIVTVLYGYGVFRRPTCLCRVYTAVSGQHLPALYRVAQAHRVLEQLRPLIADAQQDLQPPTLEELQQFDPSSARHATSKPLPPLSSRSLMLHAALFTLLAVDAGLNLYSSFYQSSWVLILTVAVILVQTVCATMTFVVADGLTRARLRGMVVGVLSFLYARYMVTYFVLVFSSAVQHPGAKVLDVMAMFRNQYSQAATVNEVLAIVALALSLTGFAMLWLEQQRFSSVAAAE